MGAGKAGAILFVALSLCAGLLFLTGGFATSSAQSEPTAPTAGVNDEIVFIDANGFIRVFDYVDDVPPETVRWYSPIGGFADIALGDVNNDSDMEIIGVRGGPEEGELVIFDPVVVDPSAPIDGAINGIPWATLYTQPIPGDPTLVAAGNLVVDVPGDEIVFGSIITDAVAIDDDAIYQLTALQGTTNPPTGQAWQPFVDQAEYKEEWTWINIGNIDDQGPEEIALVAYEEGWLHLYRDLLAPPIFVRENKSRPWRAAVIAPFRSRSDGQDLVAIRNSPAGVDNFWSFAYDNGRFRDDYFESFFPPPEYLFMANVDVTASSLDEAFMLRSVPAGVVIQPRLFSRAGDGDPVLEQTLDEDNGYQAGAGGNIDGDAGEEIVIIRNNRLRIYLNPGAGSSFVDVGVGTNSRTVRVGDLDAGAQPLRLAVNRDLIRDTLEQDAVQVEFEIDNQALVFEQSRGAAIPFSVTVEDSPSWVEVKTSALTTPATLDVRFNARGLTPGIYVTTIILTSPDPDVTNSSVRIAVTLEVVPGLTVEPLSAGFVFVPCVRPLAPQEQTFNVGGIEGLDYSVHVGEARNGLDWVTVASATGTTPGQFVVTVDPAPLATSDFFTSTMTVDAVDEDDSISRRVIPFYLLCAEGQTMLPLIAR